MKQKFSEMFWLHSMKVVFRYIHSNNVTVKRPLARRVDRDIRWNVDRDVVGMYVTKHKFKRLVNSNNFLNFILSVYFSSYFLSQFNFVLFRIVCVSLTRFQVAFTARIDNTEVFRRSSKMSVNTVTLNALYNVKIL